MKLSIRQIFQDSFYELLIVYTLLALFISLRVLYKYTLHFEIMALILAILGISIISPQESKESRFLIHRKLHIILFILAITFIIAFRMIPYISNSIPLGYDSGIYKYGIEHGLTNLDKFVVEGGFEPGFLYLMKPISMIFSSHFILTYLLIGFCVLLGLGIYFTTKEFFSKKTALISLLIYSLSIIQFKTFAYMYYKNIIGLSLMLFAVYFLRKHEKSNKKIFLLLFIFLAGILGSIHRPTFYIFGLPYFFYVFISPIKNKKYNLKSMFFNVLTGIAILAIAIPIYFGNFMPQVTNMIEPTLEGFVQIGEAPGTFISFFSYQFLTLAYLPFAILGFFILVRKKQFNFLFFWALINFSMVYFQFFFFKRFIIPLDMILIILSSLGFSTLIENKKKFGSIILIIMLISAGILLFKESKDARPLIDKSEFKTIQYLNNTEENAFVMATSSLYSPSVLGYSNRKTIAPGLFDYNKHNKQQWIEFWTDSGINKTKDFMNLYPKPLYIFIGKQQNDNLKNYSECFQVYYNNSENKIYRYVC